MVEKGGMRVKEAKHGVKRQETFVRRSIVGNISMERGREENDKQGSNGEETCSTGKT